MKQAAEIRAGSLALLLATPIAVMLAGILTGWAAPDPAGSNPAVAPIRPAGITDGSTGSHSASVRASWDSKTAGAGRTGNRVIDNPPSLRPSLLDTAVRGSLQ